MSDTVAAMPSFPALVAAALTVSLVSCSPLSASYESRSLKSGHTPDCQSSQAVLDSSCWDTLDIAKYLGDPVTGWNKTTPTCQPTEDGAGCCYPNEPWSTCFLRLASGSGRQDCSSIESIQEVCQSFYEDPSLNSSIKAEVRYVALTIVAIHNFFSELALTLLDSKDANTNTQRSLLSVLTLDLQPPQNPAGDLNIALSLGAAFLGNLSTPESVVALSSTTYKTSATFVQSLHQAPPVAQAMWPPSGDGIDTPMEILQRGVALIMSDVPSFVTFGGGGLYSGYPQPTFSTTTDAVPLAAAANVYTTSTILSQNGWYAVPGPVSSVAFFRAQGGCAALGTGGTVYTDTDGTTYYQSAVTARSYTFKYKGKGNPPVAPTDLLKQIDGGLAITPVLFDGAYNCTLEGAAGNLLGVRADGTLDTSCLSSLPMYLPAESACPEGATQVNGECPFGFES